MFTDTDLKAMAIEERNDVIDAWEAERYEAEDDGLEAYERHLETICYDENRAFEDWERSLGLLSYEDARDLA